MQCKIRPKENTVSLEATEAVRPIYEKYGFVKMNDEIELSKNFVFMG